MDAPTNGQLTVIVEECREGRLPVTAATPQFMAVVACCDDVAEVNAYKTQAAILAEYLNHCHNVTIEEYNAALKCGLRVEHRLGELLNKTVRRGRPEKKGHADPIIPKVLGDTENKRRMISKRAQQLASFPWTDIASWVDERTKKGTKGNRMTCVRELTGARTRRKAQARGRQWLKEQNELVSIGDFRQVLPTLPHGSVSLILTDPPYDDESVPLYGDLARLAAELLMPGGSLIVYVGHHALPAVLSTVGDALRFWWTLALPHQGNAARLPGKWVYVGWKPLLWFVKGGRWNQSYVADFLPTNIPDKVLHEWEQGRDESNYLIELLTGPDDLVVDPMCGSGTVLEAALTLDRKAFGVELDPDRAVVARGRIADARKTART